MHHGIGPFQKWKGLTRFGNLSKNGSLLRRNQGIAIKDLCTYAKQAPPKFLTIWICHQLLQNNLWDLLPGQGSTFQCDNLPDDKPATTFTPHSKTATEMAWAQPQETKWWAHQHLCLLWPPTWLKKKGTTENPGFFITCIKQAFPFTNWDQKCC